MRITKFFLYLIIVLIAVFFIGGSLIPAEWTTSRSMAIQAGADKIYPHIDSFKAWESWSPWNITTDPSIKYTYTGPDSGVGAQQHWTSDKMGNGWMILTAADPKTGVSYDVHVNMYGSESIVHGNINLATTNDQSIVTWTAKGDSGSSFVKRWMSLMCRFMIGQSFETGLNGLKAEVEK